MTSCASTVADEQLAADVNETLEARQRGQLGRADQNIAELGAADD